MTWLHALTMGGRKGLGQAYSSIVPRPRDEATPIVAVGCNE